MTDCMLTAVCDRVFGYFTCPSPIGQGSYENVSTIRVGVFVNDICMVVKRSKEMIEYRLRSEAQWDTNAKNSKSTYIILDMRKQRSLL